MRTIDELGISQTTWEYEEEWNDIICYLSNGLKYQIAVPYIHSDEETDANARLIAAAPELLAFAIAYYKANKKNAVKISPSNGDKYQSGLMLMCKEALVKAGIMDKDEVWDEEANNG